MNRTDHDLVFSKVFFVWIFSEIKFTWDDPEKSLKSLYDQLCRDVEALTGGGSMSGVFVRSYTTGSDQATVVTSVDSLWDILSKFSKTVKEKLEATGFELKVSEHWNVALASARFG